VSTSPEIDVGFNDRHAPAGSAQFLVDPMPAAIRDREAAGSGRMAAAEDKDAPIVPRLPPPFLRTWNWQVRAACAGMDSAIFFPPQEESNGLTRAAQVRRAKAVCAGCPVVAACLEHALQSREPYGVWGGRSEGERAELLGVQSLRYPAAQSRPRRRSAASRREAWRWSAMIRSDDTSVPGRPR
jgi:WhiB family redox-sensing transcriptional regulator